MTAVAALAYLAVVAGAGGYLLYFELLDRVGPIEINLVGYTVPLFAALSGWVVLGETVAAQMIVGSLVIVVGFVLIKYRTIATELKARIGAADNWRP
jgi:drug/metabolite transporter (DMT)-like permease